MGGGSERSGSGGPRGSPLLEAALGHIARGWKVFPVEKRGKRPLTAHGFQDASDDPDRARQWWSRWPDANVGVPTGPETFDALDLDGAEGEQSIAQAEVVHGDLPAGPRQHTGRGRQLFFRGGSLGTSSGRLRGVDTRGEGGYVVIAPSIHPNGSAYVLEDEDEPLPEPPEWLLEILREGGATRELDPGEPIEVEDTTARAMLSMAGIPAQRVEEGVRNDTLFRWGASMRARGSEFESIVQVLRLANTHLCSVPLEDTEVVKLSKSAARLEVAPAYRTFEASVHKTVQSAAHDHAKAAIREKVDQSNPGSGELLEFVQRLLRIPLRRVVQYGAKPPTYYLCVATPNGSGESERKIKIENLLSYAQVKRAIFDELGLVIGVRQKEWDEAAVALRSLAEWEEPELADLDEETRHYLVQFVQDEGRHRPEGEGEFRKARLASEPVIEFEDELYVYFDAFRDFCDRRGLRESVRSLWRRLKEAGVVQPIPHRIRDGHRVVSRRYWRVIEKPPPREKSNDTHSQPL